MTITICCDNLKFLVSEKFGNQQVFAGTVGMSESAISLIMSGKTKPTAGTCKRMAAALDVDVSELMVKVPRSLLSSEADALYVSHFEELENVKVVARSLFDSGSEVEDYRGLKEYQEIVSSNLRVLLEIVPPTAEPLGNGDAVQTGARSSAAGMFERKSFEVDGGAV